MFTDGHKANVWDTLRQKDMQPLSRLMPAEAIEEAAVTSGLSLTARALTPMVLVWLAITSAFHRTKNFTNVLQMVLKLLQDADQWHGKPSTSLTPGKKGGRRGGSNRAKGNRGKGKRAKSARSKHDPRGGDENLVTEEAFAQARKLLPPAFWVSLIMLLNQAFAKQHVQLQRRGKYRLLALDGTTIDLPGWKGLKDHYGTAKNQSKSRTAQARMLMLQFPQVRIPFRYELGPLAVGERTMAGRLLANLEADDLVLMDRGFFGYGLFQQIHRQKAFFAVRLMAGVNLTTLRRLDRQDRLVRWTPSDRHKWKDLPESMELRVIDYKIKGFRPSAIVTNVLDPKAISRDDWARLSTSEAGRHLGPGLYHRRWEIETTFLELKVTQGMEGGLRGRTPGTIEYEVAGHVVLYLMMRWLMVESALAAGADPLRLSFVEATREMASMRETLIRADAKDVEQRLLPLLLARIAQHRVPWRPGRHDPRPGDGKIKNKGKGKHQLPSKLMTT